MVNRGLNRGSVTGALTVNDPFSVDPFSLQPAQEQCPLNYEGNVRFFHHSTAGITLTCKNLLNVSQQAC